MTLYEINVTRVNCDGWTVGNEVVARTINPNKIDEIIKKFREEHQVNQWWMMYKQDENENIKMEVVEHDVIE